jgi:dipeptidyl aminopeptidase/acylaminoacyl peptidase
VLWHGFGPPDSEAALMAALPLDDVPAVKIYLGLPLFGERAPADGVEEVIRRQTEDVALLVFEPVVEGAAKELTRVVGALRTAHCLESDEAIGVFGFSAGGAAALIALAERDVPISAAVTLNASTGASISVAAYERATKRRYTWSARSKALAARTDAVARADDIARGAPAPALLIMHASDDAMLPANIASTLHNALRPHYARAGQEERLKLQVIPGMVHGLSDPAHLELVRREIAEWFNTRMGER